MQNLQLCNLAVQKYIEFYSEHTNFDMAFLGMEDEDWWEGHIESQPHRRGLFPAVFVKVLEYPSKKFQLH